MSARGRGSRRSRRRAGSRSGPIAVVAALALVLTACASDERSVTIVDSGTTISGPGVTADPSANELAPSAIGPSGVAPSGIDPSAVVGDQTTVAFPGQFRTLTVHLTRADGTTFDWCLLVADTERLREQGLKGVRDLGGYDGMLFRFGADQSATFWMQDTVLPLSIAFFGAKGSFVSATDMAPCPLDASATCEQFAAAAPYADAIETAQGELARAGVAAGATLAVGDATCAKH